MAADFATVRAIFEAALELPRPARDAFVAERCGDDPALRAEVEQLLAADASETAFAQVLDGSAIGLAGSATCWAAAAWAPSTPPSSSSRGARSR
jgi:hypothetical protein